VDVTRETTVVVTGNPVVDCSVSVSVAAGSVVVDRIVWTTVASGAVDVVSTVRVLVADAAVAVTVTSEYGMVRQRQALDILPASYVSVTCCERGVFLAARRAAAATVTVVTVVVSEVTVRESVLVDMAVVDCVTVGWIESTLVVRDVAVGDKVSTWVLYLVPVGVTVPATTVDAGSPR
jgi:hypothetical protein